MRVLKAGLLYFALVFGTGFLLGTVRVLFLAPRMGVRCAELLELPLMLVAIVLSARYVIRFFSLPAATTVRLFVGFFALALVVAAELSSARLLGGQSVTQYVASRDPVSGTAYLVTLILFALMPILFEHAGAVRIPSLRERS